MPLFYVHWLPHMPIARTISPFYLRNAPGVNASHFSEKIEHALSDMVPADCAVSLAAGFCREKCRTGNALLLLWL